jgi:Zn-dependent protease with chaperone function
MDKTVVMALAYALTPDDAKEYASLYPQTREFGEAIRMGDALLGHIKGGSLPDDQKLMLAAYLVCYSVGVKDPRVDSRIANLLKELGISQRYIDRVKYNVSRQYSQLVDHNVPPLHLVINPSKPLQQRLNELVRFSLAERDHHSRRQIPNLDSSEYEHRFDRMGLDILKKTKGLDLLIRAVSKYGFDRILTIAGVGGAVRINANQLPDVYAMCLEASTILAITETPALYVEQSGNIYAMCLGVEKPMVVFSSECLDSFNYAEQMFAVGCGYGHIKSGHNLYSALALVMFNDVTFALLTGSMSGIPFLSSVTTPMIMALKGALGNWRWASDFTADRAGLLCCQDIDAAISTLVKMAGMPKKYYSQINIEEFKEQAREFRSMDDNLRDKAFKTLLGALTGDGDGRSEPWTVMRAHELLKWYDSGEYQQVLDRIPIVRDEPLIDVESSKAWLGGLKDKVGALVSGKTDPEVDDNDEDWCLECGSPHGKDAKFCPRCGKTL